MCKPTRSGFLLKPLRCESNVFNISGVPDPAFPDVKWLVVVMVVDVTVLLVDEVAVLVGTRPSGTEPPRFPQAASVPSDFRAAKNSWSRRMTSIASLNKGMSGKYLCTYVYIYIYLYSMVTPPPPPPPLDLAFYFSYKNPRKYRKNNDPEHAQQSHFFQGVRPYVKNLQAVIKTPVLYTCYTSSPG